MQADPVGYIDDADLYSYTGNDPLDKTDPTGQQGSFLVCNGGHGCFDGNKIGMGRQRSGRDNDSAESEDTSDSVSASGRMRAMPNGPGAAAARKLFEQELARLRASGDIPERDFWDRLFRHDAYRFLPVYGAITPTQAVRGYPSFKQSAESGYMTVGGYNYRGNITIFMGAAHESIIDALGPGLQTSTRTMDFTLLHEYGHTFYYPSASEVLADFYATNHINH